MKTGLSIFKFGCHEHFEDEQLRDVSTRVAGQTVQIKYGLRSSKLSYSQVISFSSDKYLENMSAS